MKNIYIITGANGFLGNNIVRLLEKNNENEIRALVLPNDKIDALKGLKCEKFLGDVTKIETLKDIFNIDESIKEKTNIYVIHCASIVYLDSKYNERVYQVNVEGTKNIIKKTKEINAKLIYVSSVHAIEEKLNHEVMDENASFDLDKIVGLYAKTKAETTRYVFNEVKNNNLNACVVFPSGLLGVNDFTNTNMTVLIKKILNEKVPLLTEGGYDFVDVRDVARGVINACTKGKKGEGYILSGEYVTIKKIADLVCEYGKAKPIKKVISINMVKNIAFLFELYYRLRKTTPLFTRYSLYTLNANSNFTNAKAKKDLDYQTRSIKYTIKDLVNEIKSNE